MVKQYLEKNGKITPKRLIVKGYGKDRPIVSSETRKGRQINRRVEVIVISIIQPAHSNRGCRIGEGLNQIGGL